jgi:hypothetical protein
MMKQSGHVIVSIIILACDINDEDEHTKLHNEFPLHSLACIACASSGPFM